MELNLNKDGTQEYVWHTPNNYKITTSQVNQIKSIFKETTNTDLDFHEILRIVDLVKLGLVQR